MSKKQKYRVAGPHKVFGVGPGKTFERAIPPDQEARLLASGAIKKSTANAGGGKKADGKSSSESKSKE